MLPDLADIAEDAALREQCRQRQNMIPKSPPDPEPVIGPGMILERGRRRLIVEGKGLFSDTFYRKWQKKRIWGSWSDPYFGGGIDIDKHEIHALLLSGFRVIRPSDHPSKGDKAS